MPGHLDVWNRVRLDSSLLAPLRRPVGGRSIRPRAIVAAVATFALLGGGAVAYGVAHKTVSVDIDGKVTRVSTYSGSVEGVLDARGIHVGARDTVAPGAASALLDGSDIVVRHAKLVRVHVDGAETDVWTTALSADEALSTLKTRGGDVRLVASRSASGGRAELPVGLTTGGPVDVAVDGQTRTTDGARGLGAALSRLGISLGALDRVSIERPTAGAVRVVVNRVFIKNVTDLTPIPFDSTEQPDAARFVGQKSVTTAGVAGQRTTVNHVTTVDGTETARVLLSDAVSVAPVTEVVGVGTKNRPVAVTKAAAPAVTAAAAPERAPAAPSPNVGGSADSLNWAALAACESGGRATAVSSNGLYHGLYQFSVGTWGAVGGSGLPSEASADEQTMRAKILYDRSGPGQWPHCGPQLFS